MVAESGRKSKGQGTTLGMTALILVWRYSEVASQLVNAVA